MTPSLLYEGILYPHLLVPYSDTRMQELVMIHTISPRSLAIQYYTIHSLPHPPSNHPSIRSHKDRLCKLLTVTTRIHDFSTTLTSDLIIECGPKRRRIEMISLMLSSNRVSHSVPRGLGLSASLRSTSRDLWLLLRSTNIQTSPPQSPPLSSEYTLDLPDPLHPDQDHRKTFYNFKSRVTHQIHPKGNNTTPMINPKKPKCFFGR